MPEHKPSLWHFIWLSVGHLFKGRPIYWAWVILLLFLIAGGGWQKRWELLGDKLSCDVSRVYNGTFQRKLPPPEE